MIESIESYLAELARLLARSDPATRQDALADAGEHLASAVEEAVEGISAERTEAGEREALERVIEAYGTPEEVAVAYRETELRHDPLRILEVATRAGGAGPTDRPALVRFFSVLTSTRAHAALFYLLVSSFTGILYGGWLLVGVGLCLYTIPLWIGFPLFTRFVASISALAFLEGRIVETLLGVRMPRRPPAPRRHRGWWTEFRRAVTSGRTWRTFSYLLLRLPLGCAYLYGFAGLFGAGLELIALPIFYLFDWPCAVVDGVSYHAPAWALLPGAFAGVLLITVTMHLARFVARRHGDLAKALLVSA